MANVGGVIFGFVFISICMRVHAVEGQGQYLFLSKPWYSWTKARACCQAHNMELVKVENLQENNWIYDMVQKITLNGGYYIWIGARHNSSVGRYTWYDDTPVTWSAWAAAEPSSDACVSGRFVSGEMQWDAHGCVTAYSFVCETPDTPSDKTIAPPGDCPKTIKGYALSDSRVGPGGKVQTDFTDGKFAFPNTTDWTYFKEVKLSPIEDCTIMCLETTGCNHVTYFDDFTCRLYGL